MDRFGCVHQWRRPPIRRARSRPPSPLPMGVLRRSFEGYAGPLKPVPSSLHIPPLGGGGVTPERLSEGKGDLEERPARPKASPAEVFTGFCPKISVHSVPLPRGYHPKGPGHAPRAASPTPIPAPVASAAGRRKRRSKRQGPPEVRLLRQAFSHGEINSRK